MIKTSTSTVARTMLLTAILIALSGTPRVMGQSSDSMASAHGQHASPHAYTPSAGSINQALTKTPPSKPWTSFAILRTCLRQWGSVIHRSSKYRW